MSEHHTDPSVYVAPREAPTSRRPPITTVGPLGWLRENLFSSTWNTLATIITGGLVIWFLAGFLGWSIRSAQWAVVYNNLRLLNAGRYPAEEIWRLELTAGILTLLLAVSIGLWSRVARSVFITLFAVLFFLLIVPIIGARISEPDIYLLLEPRRAPSALVFIGEAEQEVTVTIDPLDTLDDADRTFIGFIETRSRSEWSTQARAISEGELDPTTYNLAFTLALLGADATPLTGPDGAPLALVAGPGEAASVTFTLPDTGWFALDVQRDDDASDGEPQGYAWLKVSGVELFSTAQASTEARAERFGPPPDLDGPAGDALLAGENAYRFEGSRTLAEFISLQVSPLFNRLAGPVFVGTLLLINGWAVGLLGRTSTYARQVRRATLIGWIIVGPLIVFILFGLEGNDTLPRVPTTVWEGLLLTLILTFVAVTASFPLGVALALGRRSDLPAIKWTCTLIIEIIRGVPLITILFMAKLIVPFFWSELSDLDLTLRMMIGLTLFTAAYQAENVRGGLQIVPQGQVEAARALGMNPFLTTTFIVLPQALRAVIPAIMGQFIAIFKDTSLVALVGLFELVGIVDIIVSGQTIYRPFQREAYLYIALVYFIISYAMSDAARRLEESGAGSIRKAG